MKSSYELAMERLNKAAPAPKLNADQKKQIAELESKYKAKVAERELGLGDAISAAAGAGNFEEMEKVQKQLAIEKANRTATEVPLRVMQTASRAYDLLEEMARNGNPASASMRRWSATTRWPWPACSSTGRADPACARINPRATMRP